MRSRPTTLILALAAAILPLGCGDEGGETTRAAAPGIPELSIEQLDQIEGKMRAGVTALQND